MKRSAWGFLPVYIYHHPALRVHIGAYANETPFWQVHPGEFEAYCVLHFPLGLPVDKYTLAEGLQRAGYPSDLAPMLLRAEPYEIRAYFTERASSAAAHDATTKARDPEAKAIGGTGGRIPQDCQDPDDDDDVILHDDDDGP